MVPAKTRKSANHDAARRGGGPGSAVLCRIHARKAIGPGTRERVQHDRIDDYEEPGAGEFLWAVPHGLNADTTE
jgi:hypothetical protein